MARLRVIATAAVSALALLLAIPGSASANADGDFYYRYKDANGEEHSVTVTSPPDGRCYEVPEVENGTTTAAYTPDNATDVEIDVYDKAHCQGNKFIVGENTSLPGRKFVAFYVNVSP
ncbi:hypothetical protein AB0N17_43450 [Streptomyces sp. NPDC051133]|uniref:hypothetical protein n=1 Tax=Streptomyces sp. NPDC051133 TaxID=3155521 RepID=UPI00344A95AA